MGLTMQITYPMINGRIAVSIEGRPIISSAALVDLTHLKLKNRFSEQRRIDPDLTPKLKIEWPE